MKNLLSIIVLSTLSFSAFGDVYLKTKRLSRRVNQRIQNQIESLTPRQAILVQRKLQTIKALIDQTGGGLPPTQPQRPPQRPTRGVDALSLVIAGGLGITQGMSEDISKAITKGLKLSGHHALASLASSCNATRTWRDNEKCLKGGMDSLSQSIFKVSQDVAIKMTKQMCIQTSTWNNEAGCFKKAIRASNSAFMEDSTIGCMSLPKGESAAKCFRSALSS